MPLSDAQLLRAFIEEKSNSAFADLVQRHIGMVYATALRRTSGDTGLAEDATQQVFIDLSKKASRLLNHTSLASWLYRGICFAAAKAIRAAERERSKIAASALLMENQTRPPEWDALSLHLDEVMADLPEADRHAVLLRYFEDRSYRDVGVELGVSEEAARKRVDRAVDRLRDLFCGRGIQTSSSALASGLAASLAVPAPAALSAVICQGAALTVTLPATGTIVLTTMTKLQLGATAAFVAVAVTTCVIQHQTTLHLKEEIHKRQQQAAAAAAFPAAVPSRARPISATSPNKNELLRLRGEVTALRQRVREMSGTTLLISNMDEMRRRLGGGIFPIEQTPGTPFARNRYYPREIWGDVGLDSPQAVLQTALWAATSGNFDRLVDSLHWPANSSTEQKNSVLARLRKEGLGAFPGLDAVGIRIENWGGTLASDDIHYFAWLDYGKDRPAEHVSFFLNKVDGNWRLAPRIPVDGNREDYSIPLN